MKKSLIAFALLAALSGMAYAQSSVTIYGIVDAGIVAERGGIASGGNKISSGVASPSRLGFRGTEAIGDGVSAVFVLEAGLKLDTGEIDAAGTIFNRQAYVGLSSRAGTLTLGRQYTPVYLVLSTVADPFGAGLAGSAKNLLPAAGASTRTSNTILYASPKVDGFSGQLAYSLGEQVGGGTQAGRQFGAAVAYSTADLNVHLAYNNRDSSVAGVVATTSQIGRNLLLAANYTISGVKAYAAIGRNEGVNSSTLPNSANPFGGVKPTASLDSQDLLLGVAVPSGGGTVLASYIRKNDRTKFDQDAEQWALGYLHKLSSRSTVYTAYGKIKNHRGAGYTVGNGSEAGSGDSAFNLGLRHAF
jgi:GBP family porin